MPKLTAAVTDNPGVGNIDLSKLFGLGLFQNQNDLIRNLFSVALAFAGLIFFLMLVIGGFRYLTAGGDEKAATEGQRTLTRAFIGLVIVIAAVLILQIVVSVFGLSGTSVGP